MAFDTHKAVEALTGTGFDATQAKVITNAVRDGAIVAAVKLIP